MIEGITKTGKLLYDTEQAGLFLRNSVLNNRIINSQKPPRPIKVKSLMTVHCQKERLLMIGL